MAAIGIMFDIDELGGGFYGFEAYKILFRAVDPRLIAPSVLRDGDTSETLTGKARHYCISVESADASAIAAVRTALTRSDAKGLLPQASRFIDERRLTREPLVPAGRINVAGALVNCETTWMIEAFASAKHDAGVSPSGVSEDEAPPAGTTGASTSSSNALPNSASTTSRRRWWEFWK